MEKSYDLVRSN